MYASHFILIQHCPSKEKNCIKITRMCIYGAFSWDLTNIFIYIILFLMKLFALISLLITATLSAQEFQQVEDLEVSFQVELLYDGLEVPWDIETYKNRTYILQRNGIIRVVVDEQLQNAPYYEFTDIYVLGQGGLFDLVFDPRYEENSFVYISRTIARNDAVILRLSRFTDTGSGLDTEEILYDANPVGFPKNFGGRLVIDRRNKLYMTIGDRGQIEFAQYLDRLHGKIIRLNLDGSVPPDNPFVSRPGVLREIYSFGHRNPQGIAVDPERGNIYASEHGPSGYDAASGGDEINKIEPGQNYGWPIIYHKMERRGMVSPLISFLPSTSPASAMFYNGSMFPEWWGKLFVGNLRGMSIQQISINNTGRKIEATYTTLFEGQYGRIRALGMGADGSILFATSEGDRQDISNRDRVFRIFRNE